jgi:hypothetical protein
MYILVDNDIYITNICYLLLALNLLTSMPILALAMSKILNCIRLISMLKIYRYAIVVRFCCYLGKQAHPMAQLRLFFSGLGKEMELVGWIILRNWMQVISNGDRMREIKRCCLHINRN